uniref:Recep_L_domain domain-containing protein n=1 Tax=Heterorhabditis bacteriophora TaxID=37862 RepID=A0A1I7X0M1_HETBA
MVRSIAFVIFMPLAIGEQSLILFHSKVEYIMHKIEIFLIHKGIEGQRLRGFPVIGLTYNKIVTLPDQRTLLAKFPDLKVIDVERNPDFECNSLSNYDVIKIVSDCDKNISEISRVPRIFRPTKDCDFSCQAQRHYNQLHDYVLHLWDILREKYHNFDYDATMQKIEKFFTEVVQKINTLGKDIHNNFNKESIRQLNSTESASDQKEVEIPT